MKKTECALSIVFFFMALSGCGSPKSPAAPLPGPAIAFGAQPLVVTRFAEMSRLNILQSDQRPERLTGEFTYLATFSGRLNFFEIDFEAKDCANEPTREFFWIVTNSSGESKTLLHFSTETPLPVEAGKSYTLRIVVKNPDACQSLFYGFALTG